MTLLVPNGGEVILLEYAVNKNGNTQNLEYRLFQNNITPAETDTAASYTIPTGGGYVDKTMAGASWTITPGAPSSASYAQQTWTFTGALTGNATLYGYIARRVTGLELVYAENFSAFQPQNNGDQILLTPNFTAD